MADSHPSQNAQRPFGNGSAPPEGAPGRACRQTELVQGLRQPLRTILSFMHILDEEYAEGLDDDGRRYLGFVLDASQRMYRMVESLDRITSLERSDPSQRADVEIEQVFEGAVDSVREMIRHHRARVLQSPLDESPSGVRGFGAELEMGIAELLRNAVVHGGPDAHVELSVFEVEHEGAPYVAFEVRDHGPGIPGPDLERSRELYRKLGTKHPRDAGAGLTLAAAVAELHGGELQLSSADGGGLRARILIER